MGLLDLVWEAVCNVHVANHKRMLREAGILMDGDSFIRLYNIDQNDTISEIEGRSYPDFCWKYIELFKDTFTKKDLKAMRNGKARRIGYIGNEYISQGEVLYVKNNWFFIDAEQEDVLVVIFNTRRSGLSIKRASGVGEKGRV